MKRLPGVLVIGAMKAGTTSLWDDLAQLPAVYVPKNKEPGDLGRDKVLTVDGKKQYLNHFAGARPGQQIFDFSTDMAKYPIVQGAPYRAQRIIGPEAKIVYLTRDPVARLLSHHGHLARLGKMAPDLEEALSLSSELVDCSRYAYQLEQWTRYYRSDQIFVSSIENYLGDRRTFFQGLGEFLALDLSPIADSPREARNQKAVGPRSKLARAVVEHNAYRSYVSPLVPGAAKDQLRSLFRRRAAEVDSDWEALPAGLRADVEGVFWEDGARMWAEWSHMVGPLAESR